METHGDTHNFGRRVKPIGRDWILKPRTTFWERLFLAEDSRFRDMLETLLEDEPVMQGIPRLTYKPCKEDSFSALVERVRYKPVLRCDLEYFLEALGGLLAITAWFGISDLHNQNIFIGTDVRTGRFLLTPLDIEVIFSDLRLPSDMAILPAQKLDKTLFGISTLTKILRGLDPRGSLAVACAYMRLSRKLLKHSRRIIEALSALPGIETEPIRVVMRDTQDYVIHLGYGRKKDLSDKKNPLNSDELKQMDRGDIPYFFRTLKNRHIRYFLTPDFSQTAYIRDRSWSQVQPPLIPLRKVFTIRSRNRALFEYGSMMLAACFLPKRFQGVTTYRNLQLQATKNSVQLHFNHDLMMRGPRHWRDYLASF